MKFYLWLSGVSAIGVAVIGHDPHPFIAAMLVIRAMMELKK